MVIVKAIMIMVAVGDVDGFFLYIDISNAGEAGDATMILIIIIIVILILCIIVSYHDCC